jgi:hypothetical protein
VSGIAVSTATRDARLSLPNVTASLASAQAARIGGNGKPAKLRFILVQHAD